MSRGRGKWLVTINGLASAAQAKVISRHHVLQRAIDAQLKKRYELFAKGDPWPAVHVENAADFIAAGGKIEATED